MYDFNLSKEMQFFVFLLNNYAAGKGLSPKTVYDDFKKGGILEYINEMYFIYHQESLTNAFEDIDSILENGQSIHGWKVNRNSYS
jgi:hypothetical protein